MTYTLEINEEELTQLVKEELIKQICNREWDYDKYREGIRIADHEVKHCMRDYFAKWLSDNREKVDAIVEKVVEKHINESAKSHCGIIGKRLQQ